MRNTEEVVRDIQINEVLRSWKLPLLSLPWDSWQEWFQCEKTASREIRLSWEDLSVSINITILLDDATAATPDQIITQRYTQFDGVTRGDVSFSGSTILGVRQYSWSRVSKIRCRRWYNWEKHRKKTRKVKAKSGKTKTLIEIQEHDITVIDQDIWLSTCNGIVREIR